MNPNGQQTANGRQAAMTRSNEPPILALLRQPAMQDQMSMALPKHLTPERFIRMALTCLRTTPKLALCTQQSLLGGLFELAQLGLEPNTPLGHGFLIPYGSTAQVVLGYKGLIALADRSEITLVAEVVYENDEFDFSLGTEPYLKHRPCEDSDKAGELRYAYAVAHFANRKPTFRIVTRADIHRARDSSAAYKAGQQNKQKRDSPWYTDPPSMWRKTAVRRIASFLPMSTEFARAVQLDAEADRGAIQRFELPDMIDIPEDPEAEAKRLRKELDEANEGKDKTVLDDLVDSGPNMPE